MGKPREWDPKTLARVALFAVPTLVHLGLAISHRWLSDDGLINVRIARNLLDGHGYVYNLGERVEAATSTLWIVVLAAAGWLGLRLDESSVFIGIALSALAVLIGVRASELLHVPRANSRALVPLGALVYIAIPTSADFASSGLETGLSIAWLAISFATSVRLARSSEASLFSWCGFAFIVGLGPLVRPDLALFSLAWCALFGAALFIRSERWRVTRLGLFLVSAAALPLAYQIFRMGYFAATVPNTAIAKDAFAAQWSVGLEFAANFFLTYWLPIPLTLTTLAVFKRARSALGRDELLCAAAVLLPPIIATLHILYYVRTGGGFMHGRLLLPGLFAALLPVMAVPLGTTLRAWSPALLAWLLVALLRFDGVAPETDFIIDERAFQLRTSSSPHPIRAEVVELAEDGRSMRRQAAETCPETSLPPASADHRCTRTVFVDLPMFRSQERRSRTYPLRQTGLHPNVIAVFMRQSIGAAGTVAGSQIHIVDHLGLTSPIASRLIAPEAGRPGHTKRMPPAYMIARFAEPTSGDSERVIAARELLSCSQMPALLAAVTEPMSLSRFRRNLELAYSLTSFRLPADPIEARDALCRDGGDERAP